MLNITAYLKWEADKQGSQTLIAGLGLGKAVGLSPFGLAGPTPDTTPQPQTPKRPKRRNRYGVTTADAGNNPRGDF